MFRRAVLLFAFAGAVFVLNAPLALTVLALLLLITIHEAGHLVAARIAGVRAPEFSVGFGGEILAHEGKQTRWVLRSIPLGGYVKLSGQGAEGDDWQQTTPARRIFIAAAGPFVNLVAGVILFFAAMLLVGSVSTTGRIGEVVDNSPAAQIGIRPGDRIVEVDGTAIVTYEALVTALGGNDGKDVALVVERPDGTRSRLVTDLEASPDGRLVLGVGPETVTEPLGLSSALRESLVLGAQNVRTDVGQVATIGKALVVAPLRLVGVLPMPRAEERPLSPIGLAEVASVTGRDGGLAGVLWLTGVVSIFVGVFNLLPVPPLDGGKIVTEPLRAAARRLRLTGRFSGVRTTLTNAIVLVIVVGSISTLLLDLFSPLNLP
jgi:regulator of sigma E protease